MDRFADLGLEVHVCEMDSRIDTIDGTLEERQALQARAYANVLEACLTAKVSSETRVKHTYPVSAPNNTTRHGKC